MGNVNISRTLARRSTLAVKALYKSKDLIFFQDHLHTWSRSVKIQEFKGASVLRFRKGPLIAGETGGQRRH